MKNLTKLTLSILILFTLLLSACSTNQSTPSTHESVSLILTTINSEGYHFRDSATVKTDNLQGAFLTHSDIEHYNLTDIQTGDTVSMVFDEYGDIVEVNN